jgi:hypothetical protein
MVEGTELLSGSVCHHWPDEDSLVLVDSVGRPEGGWHVFEGPCRYCHIPLVCKGSTPNGDVFEVEEA